MDIAGLSAPQAAQKAQQTQQADAEKQAKPGDGEKLSETYNTFLRMLTTQMQNQDPLDPMDSSKFTDQLVQYSSVEQQIKSNERLDKLIGMQSGNATTAAVGMIGKEIETSGDALTLDGGTAEFAYELGGERDSTAIQVLDSSGQIVRRMSGETEAGRHTGSWDGKSDTGADLPDGDYRLVVAGVEGEEVTSASTFTYQRVTGVETTGEGIELVVGEGKVSLDDVRAIREPDADA